MDLRRATKAVGILHARIFVRRAMRFADGAAFVEVSEILRSARGAGVGAGVHDAGVECAGAAAKSVEGKSCGYIGGVDQDVRSIEGDAEQREHTLRTVEKREAFFRFE